MRLIGKISSARVAYSSMRIGLVFLMLGGYLENSLTLGQTKASEDVIRFSSRPWPQQIVEGGIVSKEYKFAQYPSFGNNTHLGIDIAGGCGKAVFAAAGGKVVDVVTERDPLFQALGNAVRIRHAPHRGKPTYSLYLHMQDKPLVAQGSSVEQGQKIGMTGTTGASFGCHLHFEVRHFDDLMHPELIINGKRNIYGPGDWRQNLKLFNSWSDPEVWFSGSWESSEPPGLTLSVGNVAGGFDFRVGGQIFFDGNQVFDSRGTGNEKDYRLLVFPSKNGAYAIVFYYHIDFGAMRVALVDLTNAKVTRFTHELKSRVGPLAVYWASNRGLAAFDLRTEDLGQTVVLVDAPRGIFGIYMGGTKAGVEPAKVDISRMAFSGDGKLRLNIIEGEFSRQVDVAIEDILVVR